MKKPLLIAGGIAGVLALAVVAVVAIQLLRSDDPDLLTEAPLIASTAAAGAASGPEAVDARTPVAPSDGAVSASGLPAGVREFVIVPAESSAKYVVRESLRGLKTNAVGVTSAIEGSIFVTEEGLSDAAKSSFRVDLSTLKSDESMRDSFIKRNTLETNRFQFAEFVLESVSGFPVGYMEDTEAAMTISGTLTIRDVAKPVTWTVKARQLGDTLSAVADLTISFQDFGMSPPRVPIATAEDEIQLQVVIVAREQS